jgi:hypothetical protein
MGVFLQILKPPVNAYRRILWGLFGTVLLLTMEYVLSHARPAARHALPRLRPLSAPLNVSLSTRCVASRGFGAARAASRGAAAAPGGERVLLFMLDDRPVSHAWPETIDFVSISAMHNYQYALAHGYDFVLFRPSRKAPARDPLGADIGEDPLAKDFQTAAKGITGLGCFSRAAGAWRASTWCKVLALWALTAEDALDAAAPRFDVLVFIDSDAVVAFPALPVAAAFNNDPRAIIINGKTVYGRGGPSGARGVDAPWGAPDGPSHFLLSDKQRGKLQLANLGFFVARDSPQLRPLLKS